MRESVRFLVESPATSIGGTAECLIDATVGESSSSIKVTCESIYQSPAPLALPCPPCPLPRLFPRWSSASARTVCNHLVHTHSMAVACFKRNTHTHINTKYLCEDRRRNRAVVRSKAPNPLKQKAPVTFLL